MTFPDFVFYFPNFFIKLLFVHGVLWIIEVLLSKIYKSLAFCRQFGCVSSEQLAVWIGGVRETIWKHAVVKYRIIYNRADAVVSNEKEGYEYMYQK